MTDRDEEEFQTPPDSEEERLEMPAAWRRALVRFEDGYGHLPDFSVPLDVIAFVPLLEETASDESRRALVEEFARRIGAPMRAVPDPGEVGE